MSDETLLDAVDILSETMHEISSKAKRTKWELEIMGRIDRVLAILNEEAERRGLRQSERRRY